MIHGRTWAFSISSESKIIGGSTMLQTQINKLESAVDVAAAAIRGGNFNPTLKDYEFFLDQVVDCLDGIIGIIGRDGEVTDGNEG